MTEQVIFEVANTWTSIVQSDPFILSVLSKESSYPTPQAIAIKHGFVSPEGESSGWDGWIRLLHQPKTMYPYFPTGLLSRLTRICAKYGYQPYVQDKRVRPEIGFPELVTIPLRDYQEAAVEAGVKVGRGIFDLPPRSGKSRLACELHRRIALPTLWIAPTDRIVDQTTKVIAGFFGTNYVEHLIGSKWDKLADMPIVTCTAATAVGLSQEFYNTRKCLIVDEFHHSGAKSYTKEIFPKCDHIWWRFGMTGTNFRSGTDAMAMHGLLSNTIYKVTSAALLRRGYLVPTKVVFVPVPAHPKLRGAGTMFSGGFGKQGIHEHHYRNQLVTLAAVQLWQLGRKVLILVGTKAQGRELSHNLGHYLPQAPNGSEFDAVEFLSTDRPRDVQVRIIDSFLANQEVKILLGTSLLGEGVDLPNVDALVYARGEKAEVSLTQNAYRVCTAIPGKRDAIIVDFADRHHRHLMAHSEERLECYYAEPTFDVTVLPSADNLIGWLNKIATLDPGLVSIPVAETNFVLGSEKS